LKVIAIRKKYKIKIPDSIVIATSLYLDLPLVTADSDFRKVEELNLIFYER
jgi:predicted nucleic acid-binding protein